MENEDGRREEINQDNNENNNENIDDNSSDLGDTTIADLADIIKEKDARLLELEKDIKSLKKSNAELLVKVNAGTNQVQEKTFEEILFGLVGEPTKRR